MIRARRGPGGHIPFVRPGLRVHYGRQLAPSSAVARYEPRLRHQPFVTSGFAALVAVGVLSDAYFLLETVRWL